jgi:hypothetical protein
VIDEGFTVANDLDAILRGWEFKPGMVQARLVRAVDGREVIQLRLDLGMLQMETIGRPDGERPHGHLTFFDYLQHEADRAERAEKAWAPDPEQCQAADREFIQFYHRRVAWLALHQFDRAMNDSDHTLAFMDFLKRHSPSQDFTLAHEQYRGFVLFHRTQAAAAKHLEAEDPERAIDELRTGQRRILDFFVEHGLEEHADQDAMLRQLRDSERSLRENHSIEVTLRERLDQAVDAEDYELAARLRDKLRDRTEEHRTAPRADP